MSYCFNPACENPQNPEEAKFCVSCSSPMVLKNRYRSLQIIGEGNFGRTLLGKDTDRFDAKCVIKQLFKWRQVQSHEEAIAKVTRMFEREAKLLLQLGAHPQIPTLLACFEENRRFYIIQESIEGQNLLEEMIQQGGAFGEQAIWDLLRDLLPVLKFIHEHHVIHRDIKPMNIIRRQSDNKLVLVDFGLAKQLSAATIGQTGSRYGTEGYAPPEQTRGKVYPASDLYSLGVTCIQLLTCTGLDELYDAEEGVWVWREYLRQQGTDVSDRLSEILAKLLKDKLKERYRSSEEVLKDIKGIGSRWQCIRILSGHLDKVYRVTFSPDGQTIASGSDDKTLKVWHLSSGKLIHSQAGDSQGVSFVVASPDGQIIASGSGDSAIQLWHVATEKLLHVLTGHSDAVYQVAFSPNGEIASASADGTIKIWHRDTGKLLKTLTGHSGAVRSAVISPDGKILASGSEDKTIKIWHLGSGLLLHSLTEHSETINSLAISPDGLILASGSGDNTIRIWHLGSGKLVDILRGHTGAVRSVTFSSDGQIIASGSDDRTIAIWQRD